MAKTVPLGGIVATDVAVTGADHAPADLPKTNAARSAPRKAHARGLAVSDLRKTAVRAAPKVAGPTQKAPVAAVRPIGSKIDAPINAQRTQRNGPPTSRSAFYRRNTRSKKSPSNSNLHQSPTRFSASRKCFCNVPSAIMSS